MDLAEKVERLRPLITSIVEHDDAPQADVEAALISAARMIGQAGEGLAEARAQRQRRREEAAVDRLAVREMIMADDLAKLKAERAARVAALEETA